MTTVSWIGNFLIALSLLAATATSLDKQPVKRSYVCPPRFIRLSHRCYFFSKEKATWQDAFYQCNSLHSFLAIVKNANQDKLIRTTLNRTLVPSERWLGGRFDWQRKQWKWAASGKPLTYKGFDKSLIQDSENLQWQCITIDPDLQYKWNHRSCLEKKHFICHRKIQTVSGSRSRKKLMEQYNTNKLNEIPVPETGGDSRNKEAEDLKRVQPQRSDPFHVELYPFLGNAETARGEKKGRKTNKKNKKKQQQQRKRLPAPALKQFPNGTVYENEVLMNDQAPRRRRNRVKTDEFGHNPIQMYYATYRERGHRKHPLHPNPIVEEYKLVKAP